MGPIKPYGKKDALQIRRLIREDFYRQNRSAGILIQELWSYILHLENRIKGLESKGLSWYDPDGE